MLNTTLHSVSPVPGDCSKPPASGWESALLSPSSSWLSALELWFTEREPLSLWKTILFSYHHAFLSQIGFLFAFFVCLFVCFFLQQNIKPQHVTMKRGAQQNEVTQSFRLQFKSKWVKLYIHINWRLKGRKWTCNVCVLGHRFHLIFCFWAVVHCRKKLHSCLASSTEILAASLHPAVLHFILFTSHHFCLFTSCSSYLPFTSGQQFHPVSH